MKPMTLALAMALSWGGTLAYAQIPDVPNAPVANAPTPESAPSSLLTVPPTPPGYAPIPGLTDQYGDFRGMFTALTDPKIISATQLTQLGDDEEVLGLTLNGQSRAYPARFIAWHHIINDTLGGKPVVITYCSVCNTGVGYDPTVEGKRRLFQVFGLYRGVMAMIDPSTNTIWSHIAGEALRGSDKGKTLTALPVVNTTWGAWKALHPDTTTPGWDTPYAQYYQDKIVSGVGGLPPMFPATIQGLRDDRLPQNTLLLAVRVEGQPRVYPYDTLAKAPDVVEETIGQTPIAAFYVPATHTGAAFDRRLEGKTLDFTHASDKLGVFLDKQTGSQWTIEGKCIGGTMVGKQLTHVFSLQSRWYGWSAYFPQTTVYTLPDMPTAVVPKS